MKYMLLIYVDEVKGAQVAKEVGVAQMSAPYMAYTEALKKAGVILGGDRLQPTTTATTVKVTDGISIYPTLVGQTQTNKHDFLYWEFHEKGFQQAARMGDWKAVRPQANEPLELYNLATDLGEKVDLAKQNPAIVAKFEDYFKTARTESPNWPIKPKPPEKKEADTAAKP